MKNLSSLKILFIMGCGTLIINSAYTVFWSVKFKRVFITFALETIGLSKGTSILDTYMLSGTQLISNYQSKFLDSLTTIRR
ncbi:hypothetical protein [Colwellia sp. UCD-KL20]|uniref:hypothetical protein n=1 Tax=Colwellia sp. UCD-KL20 TaxID=1917165 RepID=UPI000970DFB9|nr:hypothetical protein [Colwellia sp. UCD-KL20]